LISQHLLSYNQLMVSFGTHSRFSLSIAYVRQCSSPATPTS